LLIWTTYIYSINNIFIVLNINNTTLSNKPILFVESKLLTILAY